MERLACLSIVACYYFASNNNQIDLRLVKQILIMEYAFEKIRNAISHLKNISWGNQSQTGTATDETVDLYGM